MTMTSPGARFRRFLPVLIAGAYAWLVTVAPVLVQLAQPSWAIALGWLGLPLLLGAAWAPEARLRVGLGVYAFLGSAALVWAYASSPSSLGARAMSALAWVVYTWAWGALSASRPEADAAPAPLLGSDGTERESRPAAHGLLLAPRYLAPPRATFVPMLAVAAGLYLLAPLGLVSSGGARPASDILGQVLGLVGALILVRQAADWGNDQHFPSAQGRRIALRSVLLPLGLLLTAAGGAIWWTVRG